MVKKKTISLIDIHTIGKHQHQHRDKPTPQLIVNSGGNISDIRFGIFIALFSIKLCYTHSRFIL